MKKIYSVLVLAAAAMSMQAQTTYTKVTMAPQDWAGTYLIVCEAQSVVFNGAADELCIDSAGGPAIIQNITFSGNTLEGTAKLDSAVFTIAATDSVDWPWSIQSASGLYIGHKDTADNGLSAEWTIKKKCTQALSIDASGNFIATPRYSTEGAGAAFTLLYNKKDDNMRFRYYDATGKNKLNVQIYKQSGTPAGLASSSMSRSAVKQLKNGQIIIVKDGKQYNVLGGKL